MHPDLDPARDLSRLLRALPGECAAPYGFAEFEQRAHERACRARDSRGGARLAVAVALGACALGLLVRFGGPLPAQPPAAEGAPLALRSAPGPEDEDLPPGAGERWLASLPSEPVIVRVGTRAAVIDLQDRIAQLDDLLGGARVGAAERATLQQERSRLLGTLVQVRYAETLADGPP